jgi:hypothetical protein
MIIKLYKKTDSNLMTYVVIVMVLIAERFVSYYHGNELQSDDQTIYMNLVLFHHNH